MLKLPDERIGIAPKSIICYGEEMLCMIFPGRPMKIELVSDSRGSTGSRLGTAPGGGGRGFRNGFSGSSPRGFSRGGSGSRGRGGSRG